jgi:hypothetical protein
MAFARLFPIDAVNTQDDDRISSEPYAVYSLTRRSQSPPFRGSLKMLAIAVFFF